MDPILEIARRHGLAVIEDAAQAFGAVYRGRPVGSLGDLGTISFFPTKNLGALGDAGLLVTNDEAMAEKARLLRNHGASRRYFHSLVGGNFRLDAVQAALLGVKLPRLAEYTARRQQHFAEYNRALAGSRWGSCAGHASRPHSHRQPVHLASAPRQARCAAPLPSRARDRRGSLLPGAVARAGVLPGLWPLPRIAGSGSAGGGSGQPARIPRDDLRGARRGAGGDYGFPGVTPAAFPTFPKVRPCCIACAVCIYRLY